MGTLLLSPGSWCTQGFVCALQESVSPVLRKFCNQIPLAFKVKFPGGSQSLCLILRLGNLLWTLEVLQQWESFFGIIVLQFVGRLLSSSVMGLMVTSSKRAYATHCASQVCCSQSPCSHGRPLLTHASIGDTQTQVWLSVLWGPWVLVHTRLRALQVSLAGKKFDSKCDFCVDHNKLWKILKEMELPDHLTCLLRNLYAGQKATLRTGHETMDLFQIGTEVHQGCILSLSLFNLYAEYIMRNAGLDEGQAGMKIAGKNINNLRYADDTTLMAEG